MGILVDVDRGSTRTGGLLAVADGLTRGLRAAAFRGRRLFGQSLTDRTSGTGHDASHGRATSQRLVGGAKMRFYHRAGCPMAADRNWSAATPSEHSIAGRTPCGMCRP